MIVDRFATSVRASAKARGVSVSWRPFLSWMTAFLHVWNIVIGANEFTMTDDPVPRNVAVTLRFLRESSGNSLREMATALNETPGRKIPGRNPEQAAKFDHDLIGAIERQRRLRLWHLGRYGNWHGMPVGAILLISQFASHVRDGGASDIALTKSVAEAIRHICNYVIGNVDRMAEAAPDAPIDRRLNVLVRKCAYKRASEKQKEKDARHIRALHDLLSQYPSEARKLYRSHCRAKLDPVEKV